MLGTGPGGHPWVNRGHDWGRALRRPQSWAWAERSQRGLGPPPAEPSGCSPQPPLSLAPARPGAGWRGRTARRPALAGRRPEPVGCAPIWAPPRCPGRAGRRPTLPAAGRQLHRPRRWQLHGNPARCPRAPPRPSAGAAAPGLPLDLGGGAARPRTTAAVPADYPEKPATASTARILDIARSGSMNKPAWSANRNA
jgi:hypothetical protein